MTIGDDGVGLERPVGAADRLDREQVLAELRAAKALLEGHFVLSSDLHSSHYFQCARLMMAPARGERLCRALAAKLTAEQPALFDGDGPPLCVSPAMGAVIVGYETARALGALSLFMERKKTGAGFELRRGFEIPQGARCLMIEDVVTTGKSSLECLAAIREAGGAPIGAACLVNRSGGRADLGLPLTALAELDAPLYEASDLPPELAAIPATKPGSRAAKGHGSGGEGPI